MRAFIKMIGGFVILLLLMAHLLIVSLLMAPAPKLLELAMGNGSDYLLASDIPEEVKSFIARNRIEITGDYQVVESIFGRFIFSLIRFKHDRFMDVDEQLALDMNLLNYGKGVIGLNQAAKFYYKKPVTELSDQEWLTLINLHKIFSKK